MNQAEIICTLLIVVAALAILAKKVELPYPVLLVIGGLGLALIPNLPRIRLGAKPRSDRNLCACLTRGGTFLCAAGLA